jgi:hypothetical protein
MSLRKGMQLGATRAARHPPQRESTPSPAAKSR